MLIDWLSKSLKNAIQQSSGTGRARQLQWHEPLSLMVLVLFSDSHNSKNWCRVALWYKSHLTAYSSHM